LTVFKLWYVRVRAVLLRPADVWQRLERALDVLDMDYLSSLACALLRPLATPAQVIDRSTWQDVLRKRYMAREYDPAPLGTMEEPVDWASLPPLDKVRHRTYRR